MVSQEDHHAAKCTSHHTLRMSRRRFLELVGVAATGFVVTNCTPRVHVPLTQGAPEGKPIAGEGAVTPASSTPTAVVTEQATSTADAAVPASGLPSKVAIARANSYDHKMIYSAVRDMLDNIGGLDDVVRSGDRVAIKTNLTGGLGNEGPRGFTPMESFITHPEVVRALVELVRDAGARDVYIVEAVYQWGSYTQWGYDEVARRTGATLIDLNDPAPYSDFVNVPVPDGGSGLYDTYVLNPLLTEIDAFMSVAKMKCHWIAGVTHSMKNLFGLVPARFYKLDPSHSHRSALHGPSDETAGQRVPRIIVDLNTIRPVNLALIDGILTVEGGEGPWIQGFGPIAPGVMFAGKDPVATDAVATAAQGFDPAGPGFAVPYIRGENHIALAAAAGLGTNRLSEIETVGAIIEDVRVQFRPCTV